MQTIDFGVNSLSRFPSRAWTGRHTKSETQLNHVSRHGYWHDRRQPR